MASAAVKGPDPRLGVAIPIALALLVIGVFGAAGGFAFVNFDDPQYVTENPFVRSGLTWQGVLAAFAGFRAGNWHPLTWLSHMLDVELFGLDAGWHHRVNVALHAANAVLLFAFLRAASGATWRSAAVAALFAVHPLHVESVAWVAERKDVLSTLLFLATLAAWVRHVRRPRRSSYALVAVLFVLGLMAKPMLVTLPFVLLLVDLWPLRRWPGAPGASDAPARPAALVLEKLPLLAISAVASVVTWLAQSGSGATVGLARIPFGARAANALVSYVDYLRDAIWPRGLASFYPHPFLAGVDVPGWQVAGAALVLAGLSGLALRELSRRPYLAFGWAWYLGTLVPVVGLVQVGLQGHADRYTYVPLIGVFVAVVWAVAEVARSATSRLAVAAAPGAAAVVILALSLRARAQVETWRDSETLHRHALAVTDRNWSAWVGLGGALSDRGEVVQALAAYDEALRVAPWLAMGWNGKGTALGRLGRYGEAVAALDQAVRLQPNNGEAWYNLGIAYGNLGRHDLAARGFRGAVEANPHDARAWFNLAIASLAVGDHATARDAMDRLHHLDPARELKLRSILGTFGR